MKRVFVILVFLCSLSDFTYSQEWTLDSCLSYALQNNKDLLVKLQDIDIAKLDIKKVQSEFLPQVSLSAGADYYWKIPVQSYPVRIFETVSCKIINQFTGKIIGKKCSNGFLFRSNRQREQKHIRKKISSIYSFRSIDRKLFEQGILDKISLNQSQNILHDYKDAYSKGNADFENSLIDLKFWMGYALNKPMVIRDLEEMYLPEILSFNESKLPDYGEQQIKTNIARQQYEISKVWLQTGLLYH